MSKLQNLVSRLKMLLSTIPKAMMASVGAKYMDIEKALALKSSTIEDVDQQRTYIHNLPNKIKELADEINETKVGQ